MNKIYRLKYDRRRNQVVAVSELTAGAGKESTGQVAAPAGLTDMCSFRKILGTLTPLAFLTGLVMSLLPGIALANPDLPTGGQIVAGQGNISTNGNQMTISQNTHGLVTNWNTFDVGQNHTVQFVQPDSSAVALNRVTGGHESQILGTLTANGQVMLVNPAGVMFGKGATVNTAGLVASTKNISNADFMAGHYTFSGGSDAGAEVVNQGSLTTTKGGFIVLAADRVKNSGSIRTPGGKTVLAAGEKVTLQLDNTGLASVLVSGSVVSALVENSGLLSATDGRVYLTARGKDMLLNTVVNNTGTVEASGLSGHGGEIVLNGGDSGVVSQSGTLLADSQAGRGGKITVEGQNIHLAADSRTSATGKTGGGEVYVGGGWQGKDSHIRNASKVVMDKSATIDVSATESGNGGTAVLWSDDYTNFRGTVLAKGGALSGSGGQVETSSHDNLQAFGDVDTSAPAGKGGNWLLDPLDVTIVGGNTDSGITESGKGTEATLDTDTDHIFSPSATGAQVSAAKISEQLNKDTSVTVVTSGTGSQSGSITLAKDASIKKTSGTGAATLTLKADKDINIKEGVRADKNTPGSGKIVATSGKLNLKLLTGSGGQDGDITLERFVHIKLNGGDFYAGPGGDSGNASMFFKNDDSISADNITLNTLRGTTFQYSALNAGKDLTIKGPLSVIAQYYIKTNLNAGGKVDITAGTGDISFAASTTTGEEEGGHILIDGKQGVNIQAKSGHLKMNVVDKGKNDMTVKSEDGNISLAASLSGEGSDNDTVLTLNNTTVNAGKGSVSIKGVSSSGREGLTSSGLSIISGGTTELSGMSWWGRAANLSGLNLTSTGDISVTGKTPGRAWSTGLKIEGSTINSTAGRITLTGQANSDPKNTRPDYSKNGLEIINSNIKADSSHGIILEGTSSVQSGVRVTGSTFNAGSLDIKGAATQWGTGFSLGTSKLQGALNSLKNVTFSSAGSAAGATNTLDSSIVTTDNRDTLLAKHIGNMTRIDMGGVSIFDDSGQKDKGWVAGFTSPGMPNGSWIFDHTTVNAAGTVDLKGAGFTNSTIGVSKGDFRLTNGGLVTLNNDTITVSDGDVDVHSLAGSVSLRGTNISAKSDINIKADNGGITLTGKNKNNHSSITSSQGGINISASTSVGAGVTMEDTGLSALQSVHVSGISQGGGSGYGVYLNNSDLKSSSSDIQITGLANNVIQNGYKEAGISLNGAVTLDSDKGTIIRAKNSLNLTDSAPPVGLVFNNAQVNVIGGGLIESSSPYAAILTTAGSRLSNSNGELTIKATVDGTARSGPTGSGNDPSSGAFVMDNDNNIDSNTYNTVFMTFNADKNGNINIIADTTKDKEHRLPGMSAVTPDSTGGQQAGKNGFIFTGAGDISVTGRSWSSDGVNTRSFDNSNMTGILTINGESNSGTGVVFDKNLSVNVRNAHINGTSNSGTGVMVISESGKADFNGNTITGVSGTSDGVSIKGNNITLANGTLKGTSGTGNGVILTGGSNFTLAGASVTGESDDGTGVNVAGNLVIEDGSGIDGSTKGKDSVGVKVSGNLGSTGGSTVHGTAQSGDGVNVSGDTTLSGVTLSGDTATGTGVKIAGNLKAGENTTVTGKATETGTGVSLGASLEGGKVSGTSVDGTGLQLADNATVTSSGLSGTSTSGDGVAVTGTTVLDDTTAKTLQAVSESGSGLSLNDGASISIVHNSQSERQKMDAEGNLVTDDSGAPVMETVTTTVPVSAPVVLSGTSGTGSGVATSGNVSISGVTLNGKTDADGGTAVTLGGNLTVADAISGINASATGNGTALKISEGVVDAKGYADAGKTLVISATSEDGAAVSTSGNSSLKNVELQGTASGNGSAVVVSGSLSTDKSLTAISTGDKGAGLQLAGGLLQGTTTTDSAPVKVTVSAAGNGTAVAVTQPEDGGTGSGLSGIDLAASADRGSVMDIGGDLTTDRDISVSTENGTAISLNGGSLQGAKGGHPVTVTAQATGDGTAVTVKPTDKGKPGSSLANMTLHTTSVQGNALNVEGVLNSKDVVVLAEATGTGTALNVSGGEIHSLGETGIVAMSDSGHAAVINNGKLTGDSAGALTVTATTKTDNPALSISGNSDISNSVVSGKSSGNGSAVSVADVVTSSGGGEIKGQTVNGTAVEIKDGTSATSSQEGGLLLTATASGEKGSGVVLNNATLTGSRINADATQGNAVTIADGSITGGNIAGHTTAGTGLNISNAVLKEAVVSGTTQTGTGTVISGTLSSDSTSTITGTAT
ncbi:filamentous hemagglutinin N-terminal domain-containing protein, partial [Salmonella enterica]|nr:filamentous hemagglutinin N-terminal domain-containing protein [Salmonella enterica]